MAVSHTSAIVLAAGLGNRLRPLTNDRPKCLVEFMGKPIIVRMIEDLACVGVRKVTVVCGYRADTLRASLGNRLGDIVLEYVENPEYASTNSMYSLWLARDRLVDGSFLIEGDAICGPGLISDLAERGTDKSLWAGQAYNGRMDGCVLTVSAEDQRIVRQDIERNPVPGEKPHQFKSTGILSLGANYGRSLVNWLDDAVAAENVNIYYDLVIGSHLTEEPIHIHDIGGRSWFEVDTVDDLRHAERLFLGVLK